MHNPYLSRSLFLFSLCATPAWAQGLTAVSGGLFVGDAPANLDDTAATDFAGNVLTDRDTEMTLNNVIYAFREYDGCVSTNVDMTLDILVYNTPAVDGITFGNGSLNWHPTQTQVLAVPPGENYDGILPANTRIACYTAHFHSPNVDAEAVANTSFLTQWGTGKLNRPIIGVVYKPGSLDDWDDLCSNGGDIFYPNARDATQGGLDLDGGSMDALQIDRANNQVTMQARTPTEYDSIRVLTTCR